MNWYIQILDKQINTNLKNYDLHKNAPWFYIDGYVIPRLTVFEKYEKKDQYELLKTLYKKHGLDFIHYVKGVFTIILFSENQWHLLTDRHSIKKYYTYSKGNEIFISNSLNEISQKYDLEIDIENAAIFTLISHFINGETAFKNVKATLPAQLLSIMNGDIQKKQYWRPKELFKTKIVKNQSISFYAKQWEAIIHSFIKYLNPKGISLTLTGGNDSRMVLSALTPFKEKLHAFSFGNPKSHDCVIASKISSEIEIKYSNHYVSAPTPDWVILQAKKIMEYGNSMINFHRAHRNDAIEKEKKGYPENEMIFTGLVGGEYFKEPNFNDTTIPILFKDIELKSEQEVKKQIVELLNFKGFNTALLNIDRVFDILKENLKCAIGLNEKQQKFVYTFMFYGCTHHTQDSNVFSNHFKYVVNPFMDIDFLELLATNPSWYVNKKSNIFTKIFHSTFLVGITDQLAPELSKTPYAKRGEYSADELLRHKFKYIFNRIRSIIMKENHQYPSNFPMGIWLFSFCQNQLTKDPELISKLFNIQYLISKNEEVKNKKNEETWHLITNPINLALIYDTYKKK